jgi:cell division topological specificity factor
MEIKEVFEPVLNFIKNLQKKDKEPASKQAAKDRLKLVLMQDRASVSPDFFDIMKKEIIDVIKKYIEIDEDALEVELTRGLEAGLEGPALYANIPIKNVKPMAPKVDEDDGEDHLDDEEEQIAELENAINEATEGAPLTEEQADAVADAILTHIEEKAAEDEAVAEENAADEEPAKEEKAEEVVKAKKTTAKKTTTKKTTTAKKKTTSSKTKKKED